MLHVLFCHLLTFFAGWGGGGVPVLVVPLDLESLTRSDLCTLVWTSVVCAWPRAQQKLAAPQGVRTWRGSGRRRNLKGGAGGRVACGNHTSEGWGTQAGAGRVLQWKMPDTYPF